MRLRRLWCRLAGHQAPNVVAGRFQGYFVRAAICPRCKFIFNRQLGPRAVRRRIQRGAA